MLKLQFDATIKILKALLKIFLFTGLVILIKPFFCLAQDYDCDPFTKVDTSLLFKGIKYGFEPAVSIEGDKFYTLVLSEDYRYATLCAYRFQNNLPELSAPMERLNIDIRKEKLEGGLYGFLVFEKWLVMVCYDKVLIYKKSNATYQRLQALDADFRNIATDEKGYFVLYRYYNDFFDDKKRIDLKAFVLTKEGLEEKWSYQEWYPDIYYSHINGVYADMNKNGEFLLAYPTVYSMKIFNKNGHIKELKGDPVGLSDSITLIMQRSLFKDSLRSLKDKISLLQRNDVRTNRIQSIRFLDQNRIMVIRNDSTLPPGYKFLDVLIRGGADSSFKLIKKGVRFRDEFVHESRDTVSNYYWLPCFRCTNKKLIMNGNIYLWEIYVPLQFLRGTHYKKYEKALEEYYNSNGLSYGFYRYRINDCLLNE